MVERDALPPDDTERLRTGNADNDDTHSATQVEVATTADTPGAVPAVTPSNDQSEGTGHRCCRHIDRGSCCMKTREFVESSKFSFVCGSVLSITGVVLIALTSQLPSGDYFLIGPFCIAIGAILFIRGCVTKMAKRQQLREQREQTERNLTRDQRSRRNEELALSQDNLVIPPAYSDVVGPTPKTTVDRVQSHVQMVNAESQADFNSSHSLDDGHNVAVGIAVQTSRSSRRLLRQLSSVQSQTSFPSMVSIAVDTSDLPVYPVGVGGLAPPSYFSVTNETLTQQDSSASLPPASATYYLPNDDE